MCLARICCVLAHGPWSLVSLSLDAAARKLLCIGIGSFVGFCAPPSGFAQGALIRKLLCLTQWPCSGGTQTRCHAGKHVVTWRGLRCFVMKKTWKKSAIQLRKQISHGPDLCEPNGHGAKNGEVFRVRLSRGLMRPEAARCEPNVRLLDHGP